MNLSKFYGEKMLFCPRNISHITEIKLNKPEYFYRKPLNRVPWGYQDPTPWEDRLKKPNAMGSISKSTSWHLS